MDDFKRDRTPQDVVAQALDCASWVQELGNEDVRNIFATANSGRSFDEAFAQRFDGAPVPDELNSGHVMTIVASDLDPGTKRIVAYLNNSHAVPINVMMFRYFTDNGHEYLARTWLIDEDAPVSVSGATRARATRATWNGQDWYVAFGIDGTRSWEDGRTNGSVSAGGGDWYSRTLKGLPEGARIFVHIPQQGYVGVGIVRGAAKPADDAALTVDGSDRPFRSLQLIGQYQHPQTDAGTDAAEYIIPVQWVKTVPLDKAVWRQGMFANQNSACKLRNQFTIDDLTAEFKLRGQP